MPQVFQRALAPQPAEPAQPSPYDLLMAELQRQPQKSPPVFNDEQIRQRIRDNNAQMNLGVVGQLAGLEDVRNVGGQVFKKALGDRAERVTNRGIQDPLTGDMQIDPEYAAEQEDARRGKIFEKALRFEDQRTRAQERADARREQHQWKLEEIRARASQGRATDAELQELKKELIRSQIKGNEARVDAAGDKAAEKEERARNAQDQALARARDMLGFVDKAVDQTGFFTTGLPGALLGRVQGSGAYDLKRTVDTLKANIGFAELDAMRKASPTGGALGQVAIKELDMLQAVLGSLDPGQGEDQMLENLGKVKRHYTNWMKTVQEAQNRSVPPRTTGVSPTPGAPVQPVATPAPAQPGPGPVQTPPAAPAATRRLKFNLATGGFDPV